VSAYLWEQVDVIRTAYPQIRRDVPDSVHAMRVACRRMRSALQSFRALLDLERTGISTRPSAASSRRSHSRRCVAR
jgi:CHAD domain-containing protein